MTSSPKRSSCGHAPGWGWHVALASRLAAAGAAQTMHTGGLTSQPIGHFEFCKSNPAECAIRSRRRWPEHMTGKLWRQDRQRQPAVNNSVKPMNDFEIYGKDEVWAYPRQALATARTMCWRSAAILMTSGIPDFQSSDHRRSQA